MAQNFSKEDFENLLKIKAEMEATKREGRALADAFDALSQTLFGISASGHFERISKSASEIERDFIRAKDALNQTNQTAFQLERIMASDGFSKLGDELRKSLSNMGELSTAQSKFINQNQDAIDATKLSLEERAQILEYMNSKELSHLSDIFDSFDDINEKIEFFGDLVALQEKDEETINTKLAERHKKILKNIAANEMMTDSVRRAAEEYEKANEQLVRAKKIQQSIETNNIFRKGIMGMKSFGLAFEKNVRQKVYSNLFVVDDAINEIQKNTSVMLDNVSSFDLSSWASNMARFGLSVQEAGAVMDDLQAKLRTTDQGVMMNATEQFAMLQKAIGISSGEYSEVSGELQKMGYSSEKVAEYFEDANKFSKGFSVNTRNVVRQISANLGKMKQFGFSGGEKSLVKMAAQAERLRIQVDSIFNVAEKARTIEGAMEMAAQLQLAGGSFSQINPMDLLAAARKGPKELSDILTKMGGDIGRFNKETGEFEFDPIDAERLRIVAEATMLPLEEVQNMIQKNAEDNKKLELIPQSMFSQATKGMKNIDAEMAKGMFADMLKLGKDGKPIVVEGSLLDKYGIKSLSDFKKLDASTMQKIIKEKEEQNISLEKQAEINQSLNDSIKNFTMAFQNMFIVFQPVLDTVSGWITSLTEWMSKADGITQSFIGVGWLVGATIATGFMKSLVSGLASFGGKLGGKIFGKLGGGAGGAGGGMFSGIASSLKSAGDIGKSIDMKGILQLSGALAITGAAVVGFMYGLNKIGGPPSMEILGKSALSLGILATGVVAMSQISKNGVDMGSVIKGSIAMGIIGASIIPFSIALQNMSDVKWSSVLASIAFMGAAFGGLIALGALVAGPQAILLAAGALAMIGIGASLMLAAQSLLISGEAFEKLSKINWDGMSGMGSALMSAAPGLAAFSLSATMFLNPLVVAGIWAMTKQIQSFNDVLTPLSSNLNTSSPALAKFASSLMLLKDAAKGLDSLGALDSLSDIKIDIGAASLESTVSKIEAKIEGMNIQSSEKNVTLDKATIQKLADAIEKLQKTQDRSKDGKLEINLKMNGRELKRFIDKDIEYMA